MINNRLKKGASSNSLLLLFVSIVTTGLALIITKLLSMNFSLSEYGSYSQATLISNTAKAATLLGLTSACNYFYNSTTDDNEQRKYITLIVSIEIVVGVVCASLIIIFSNTISGYYNNKELLSYLLLVAFTPLLENIVSIYQTLFISAGKAKTIAIRNFVISTCKLFGAVIACYVFADIRTALLVLLIIDVLQVLFFVLTFYKIKKFAPLRSINKADIMKVFAFSIPMFLYTVTGTLSNDLDKYVISWFCDKETLAIYSNAAKRLPLELIATSFLTILIPIITRQINSSNKQEAKELFRQYLRIGYLSTFIIGGGAIALSNTLIQFLYDEKYTPGVVVFIVYIIIEIIRFANATLVLTASGKTKIIMYSSIIMLLLNLVFNILFFKMFGIVGPALCTLLLSFGYSLFLLSYSAKLLDSRLRDLFDFKEIILLTSEIVVLGIVIKNLQFIAAQYINHYISMIFIYLFYLVVLLILNRKSVFESLKLINRYK